MPIYKIHVVATMSSVATVEVSGSDVSVSYASPKLTVDSWTPEVQDTALATLLAKTVSHIMARDIEAKLGEELKAAGAVSPSQPLKLVPGPGPGELQ